MIRHLLAAAAVMTLAACTAASTPQPSATPQARTTPTPTGPPAGKLTGYFSSNPLDGKAILGPPPTPDSPHGKADRAVFEETRKLEGSARWKTAAQDNDLWRGGAMRRFSCAVGVRLDEPTTPRTLKLLHRVELDVRTVGTPPKDHYDRKRPLIGNDAPLCIPREDWMKTNASYPSGHAMVAWSWALILTEMSPAVADRVMTLGREAGESRVVCGVHFPSDVEAGRSLGAAMVARLHADPAFQADLAAAKRELATATAKPDGCAG